MLGVWLTAIAGSAFTACQRDASTAPTSPPAPAAEAERRRRAPLPASFTERAWWNQADLVDALSLTGEQRARMDALLLQSVQNLRAAQQGQRDQQRALKEALEAGNWEAARRAADTATLSMTAAWRAQTMLKIDVLALLDPDQQRLVTSQYRQVLRQTSVLSRRRGSIRPRSATPVQPGNESPGSDREAR